MRPGRWSRSRGAVLIWAVVVLGALPACPGAEKKNTRAPNASRLYPGPQVDATKHPFGIKWDWSQAREHAAFLSRVAGGATWFSVTWCDVEASKGIRDWRRNDAVVEAAQKLGYEMYLRLRVGSCWATGGRAGSSRRSAPSAPPKDRKAYERFVAEAVARYSVKGVHTWAIENEINARNFWTGSTAEYEALAEAVAPVVRRSDPKARIFDAGLSSEGYGVAIAQRLMDDGREDEAVAFYRAYYARRFIEPRFIFKQISTPAGLRKVLNSPRARRAKWALRVTAGLLERKVIDGFQLHFYERFDHLDDVLRHIKRDLKIGAPIEAWEVGVAWPGKDYDARAHGVETAKLLSSLLAAGIRRAIYLPLRFSETRPREIWRGLFDTDDAPRPASEAYETLVERMSGGSGWAPVAGRRLNGVVFLGEGSVTTAVVWSGGEAKIPGSEALAQAIDLTGEPVAVSGGLTIGPEPVLVVWKQSAGSPLQVAARLRII